MPDDDGVPGGLDSSFNRHYAPRSGGNVSIDNNHHSEISMSIRMPTRACAEALRDGGIDAVAALDDALALALREVPEAHQVEIKRVIGKAMSDILDATLHPAIRAFPDLEPDETTWKAVVIARAASRSKPYGPECTIAAGEPAVEPKS